MAKTASFDVTRNLTGLTGLNINTPQDTKEVPKAETKIAKDKKEFSEPRVKREEPPAPVNTGNGLLTITPTVKKVKTMHKSFVMSQKRFEQFKALANERGQSENALFNDIMTQLFGEE